MLHCLVITLICTITNFVLSKIAKCPSGWEYFQGSCYQFRDNLKTWSDALAFCRNYGADLLKISSAEENQFVQRNGKNWWLALRRDARNTGVWKWNDGSILTDTNFWATGEPNNHGNNEHCGQFRGDTRLWNDLHCESLINVACEKGSF